MVELCASEIVAAGMEFVVATRDVFARLAPNVAGLSDPDPRFKTNRT